MPLIIALHKMLRAILLLANCYSQVVPDKKKYVDFKVKNNYICREDLPIFQ